MTVVAFTGIRDIGPAAEAIIDAEVWRIMSQRPKECRFGGARGADTVALQAASFARESADTLLTVVVPGTLSDQPRNARVVILNLADEVLELGLDPSSPSAYRQRNEELVAPADLLVAFWDGRPGGGTLMTINIAKALHRPVRIVPVDRGPMTNPLPTVELRRDGFGGDYVYFPQLHLWALDRYSLETKGFVLALKQYEATPSTIKKTALRILAVLQTGTDLPQRALLVPIPRRTPTSGPPSISPVLEKVAQLSSGAYRYEPALVRVQSPTGGVIQYKRERFPAEEHARTMRWMGSPIEPVPVVLFDDVYTTGASMDGGAQVIEQANGQKPYRFTLLAAGEAGLAIKAKESS